MLQIPVGEIVNKIKEKTGLSEEIIRSKIEKKMKELSGLVSEEGAAHIVASELGVKLIESSEKGVLQIKNLVPGLRNATVIGRVLRVWEVREFEKDKIKGKVASILIGDGSGKVRAVFWNDKVKLIENLKEGDVVKLYFCYVKENNFGRKEIHFSDKSKIEINPDDEEVKEIPSLEALTTSADREYIINLVPNSRVKIKGAIVQILMRDPFFEVCPECGFRIYNENGIYICNEHGEVEPSYSMVVSSIIDDGTGTIRAVFFGKRAEILLDMSSEEAFKISEESGDRLQPLFIAEQKLLGKEILVEGDVVQNETFGTTEMIVKRVIKNPNPVIEAFSLLKNF